MFPDLISLPVDDVMSPQIHPVASQRAPSHLFKHWLGGFLGENTSVFIRTCACVHVSLMRSEVRVALPSQSFPASCLDVLPCLFHKHTLPVPAGPTSCPARPPPTPGVSIRDAETPHRWAGPSGCLQKYQHKTHSMLSLPVWFTPNPSK